MFLRRDAILLVTILTIGCSCAPKHPRFELPGLMLWAWQRAEDLSFIDTQKTGVAYLAGTARISAGGIPAFEPRLQPVIIPRSAAVLAVVRIESLAREPVDMAPLIETLKHVARMPGIRGLQIDFDARASEHRFYRSLLDKLRDQSPVPVGVTALASWCDGDRWLDHTNIVEAVPMFFRMRKDETRNMRIPSSVCGSSIGLSMDEAWPLRRPAGIGRIYLFNPRAWDRRSYSSGLQRVREWK